MSHKFVNKVQTKYNPSVIEYSSRYQLFICGSYQLFDGKNNETIDESMKETLKRVNNRFGNLLLISKTNQLIQEFECFDGGVFDLKLIQLNGVDDSVFAAHSNGFLTIYSISSSLELSSMRRYFTESSLLTSLTPITNQSVIVGNSDGKVVFIDLSEDQKMTQLSVTKFSEPIWSLFCHQINGRIVLFIGSDDSLWRLYSWSELSAEEFSELKSNHVNNDSKAGITCFASDYSSDNLWSLIVGSYDEFIRFYTIEWICSENGFNVCFKHKLHIKESGIWRIIVRNDTLLVSGMYSGAHLIQHSKLVQTLDPLEHKTEEKELIYGLSCDQEMDNLLMASFYTKTLYLFNK